MQVLSAVAELTAQIQNWKQQNFSIAFVPTMGNLHAGHLSLVEQAKSKADKVVVSIYVNPMQFGVDEDLESYPRTLVADQESLENLSVDLLFIPNNDVMYPKNIQTSTQVTVPGLSNILCGEFRPVHFNGVSTVVNKLLNIVGADVAIFGEKDYQQVFIIRKMVADLFMPVKIESMATVREADGLAMSSRNKYLSDTQRQVAGQIYQMLLTLTQSAAKGIDLRLLESNGVENLLTSGFRVDYVSFRSTKTLLPADRSESQVVLLIAAWMGETRLIDNMTVDLTNLS